MADVVGEVGGASVNAGLLVRVGLLVSVGLLVYVGRGVEVEEGMIVWVGLGGGMKGVLLGVGVVLMVGVGVIVGVWVVVAVIVIVGVWLGVVELVDNGGVKLVVGVRVKKTTGVQEATAVAVLDFCAGPPGASSTATNPAQ
ncbi:MAG: hypothetical protein WAV05_00440 [Anaerolineales bacterium]